MTARRSIRWGLATLVLLSLMAIAVTSAATRATGQAIQNQKPGEVQVPKQLLEQRRDAAKRVFEQHRTRIKNAQGLPAELFGWSERWLDAELAVCGKESERVNALKEHLNRARDLERITTNFAKTGQGRQADADAAHYFRLEAEIRLVQAGVEPSSVKERE